MPTEFFCYQHVQQCHGRMIHDPLSSLPSGDGLSSDIEKRSDTKF